jgi:hypothetical protein
MKTFMKKVAVFFMALPPLAASAWSAPRAAHDELGGENYPLNEIEASSTARLTFQSGADASFAAGLGYSRALKEFLQLSGVAGISTQSGFTALNLLAGPTFNLAVDQTGLRGAAYGRVLVGVAYQNFSSLSGTSLGYVLEGGKRFELVHDFTFRPALRMSGVTASGATPSFSVIPLQFSFLF